LNKKIQKLKETYNNSAEYDLKLAILFVEYIHTWTFLFMITDKKLFKKRKNYSVVVNNKDVINLDDLPEILIKNFFTVAYK
ncbi:hypothetical protein, partial [Mycoplasma yeatsii]|uniref:hypothetical protein n=1 Tax=Mycoplasma yeatsii TaxID=51365 RepID=UPI00055CCD87